MNGPSRLRERIAIALLVSSKLYCTEASSAGFALRTLFHHHAWPRLESAIAFIDGQKCCKGPLDYRGSISMPSRAIQIGINIGVLMVCSVISVVLLEIAIRIFLPVYIPSDQLGFVRLGDVTVGRPGGAFRLSKNAGDFDVEILSMLWDSEMTNR
jgi:hypothetical protein